MKKTQKKTIINIFILSIILSGIAGYYYLKMVPDSLKDKEIGKVLLLGNIFKDDIIAVETSFREVVSNGPTNYYRTTLLKISNQWRITSPINAATDPEALLRMMNDVVSIKSERILSNVTKQQILDYHFQDPSSKIRIETKNGAKFDIINGGMASTDNLYYTVVNSNFNFIYLVYAYKFSSMERNCSDLRSKEVFNISLSEVQKFEMKADDGRIFGFTKESFGQTNEWFLYSPQKLPADDFSVKGRYLDIISISASFYAEFKRGPEILKKYDLDKPKNSILLVSKDGLTNSLYISGVPIDGFYPAYSPQKEGIMMCSENFITNKFKLDISNFIINK